MVREVNPIPEGLPNQLQLERVRNPLKAPHIQLILVLVCSGEPKGYGWEFLGDQS